VIDINNFDSIKIKLASSRQIKQWSSGEVTKPETINYRTLKPEKDGLFCEKIFGPTKDWECYCGKYKRVRYKGIVCERCGVEVTRAKVRRERMGHIELAAPVSHIWFFKGVPSRIGYVLDLAPKELEKVLYFAASIVTSVDDEARLRDLDSLQEKVNEVIEQTGQEREQRLVELDERLERRTAWLRAGDDADRDTLDAEDEFWVDDLERDRTGEAEKRILTDADRKQAESDLRKEVEATRKDIERYAEEYIDLVQRAWFRFRDLKKKDIESDETLFREMRDRFGSAYGFGEYFTGGMGAEAIKELLEDLSKPCLEPEDAERWPSKLDREADSLRETIATSKGQRHARALKRLKVISAFLRSDNRPSWMVLEAVPVIPPELRPMVQLDGGRFATSDLNDLYRRVINRNNRLKRLLDLGAPEIIVNNERRMLQEAVDALFDNGRRGRAITGANKRPLKSLSDMLKGKQGRFRQNLLGKRVDYSGRSVIVAGPDLRLHQCGLPKLMALELFKPFIMSRLVERKQVQNIKAAKKMVDSMIPEVWDVLEEVIAEHPVLLNRAPTLHRLGIQAFEPVLVEGKAIQIHPLVCTAFNADFDGDQMAVHLPLSVEAQAEARILMLSANNILSPANGRPIAVPSQDMVLGLYYLTYCRMVEVRPKGQAGTPAESIELVDLYDAERGFVLPKGAEGTVEGSGVWSADPFAGLGLTNAGTEKKPVYRPRVFSGVTDVLSALSHRAVGLQEVIELRAGGERLVTTPGRVVFNHEIEEGLRAVVSEEEFAENPFPRQSRVFTKRELGDFIEELVDLYGPTSVSQVLDVFKDLGFRYASLSGITVSKNDIVIPPNKQQILDRYDGEVAEIEDFFDQGLVSSEERHQMIIDKWENATDEVAGAMRDHLFKLNPIYMMANSGARGSFKQIRQLAGMRGCMTNPKGEIIERPIKSNFMEGLSVLEYFISTHGARKGLADTALKTADSGYLTRRLVDVSQDVIIRERDCGTTDGVDMNLFREETRGVTVNPSLLGRVVLGPVVDQVTGEVVLDLRPGLGEDASDEERAEHRAFMVTTEGVERLQALAAEHPKASIGVRSPLKCRSAVGLCAQCYGRNLASGKMCEPGDAVGIIAAQSIGEPGTQLTMRTFHTGGVAGADITQGLPRVVELFEARKPKALAQVAKVDGWVRIEDDETRPGAAIIRLVEPVYEELEDVGTGVHREPVGEHLYAVPKRTQIARHLHDGQWVEAGDLLTQGSAFPSEILAAETGLRLGLTGTVASVTAEKRPDDRTARWLTVTVDTDAGPRARHLRLPLDHPVPDIPAGTHVAHDERIPLPGAPGDPSTKTEMYLVRQVQDVYLSQGVDINDKHIEVIVRQMLKKVKIMQSGQTLFLPGQLVDKPVLYRENTRAAVAAAERVSSGEPGEGEEVAENGEPAEVLDVHQAAHAARATPEPLILGITKASLATESFLSAASFQETTKVLTDAALEGRVDHLRGLKENVIIGKLIPAATGLRRYRQLEIEPVRRAPALLEFDLDQPFSLEEDDALAGLALGEETGTYSFAPDIEPAEAPEEG
jgi:DNA-directed RNA polymerase subunit beta'